MAATIVELMQAVKVRLATISGLNTYDHAPDKPETPCAFPLVPAIPSYRVTMGRGTYIIDIPVVVLVSNILDAPSQHSLAAYANQTGDSSVRVAVEGDVTLGGIADHAFVTSFDPRGLEDVGLLSFIGGIFTVRIAVDGV